MQWPKMPTRQKVEGGRSAQLSLAHPAISQLHLQVSNGRGKGARRVESQSSCWWPAVQEEEEGQQQEEHSSAFKVNASTACKGTAVQWRS